MNSKLLIKQTPEGGSRLQKFYAHSVEGKPVEEWQRLEEHHFGTANLAKEFADEFGSGDWAYLAGQGHDLEEYYFYLINR